VEFWEEMAHERRRDRNSKDGRKKQRNKYRQKGVTLKDGKKVNTESGIHYETRKEKNE
jgi:hypothetical protein